MTIGRVAVLFERLFPYHFARLRAAGELGEVAAHGWATEGLKRHEARGVMSRDF